MILQPRDRELLARLARFGILSSSQIQVNTFKSIAHTTVMRRLRKLETESYIVRVKGLPGNESGWCLSMIGAKTVGTDNPIKYTNQNTTLHEVNLSEVRIALEGLGLASDFVSEAALRQQQEGARNFRERSQNSIPDGIFVAEIRDTPSVVAVELELQPKSHARYKKVFSDYARKSAIQFVWYIAGTIGIANTVIREWNKTERYGTSPKLLVSLLSELKEKKSNSRIFTADMKHRPLSDHFKCVSPLLSETEKR